MFKRVKNITKMFRPAAARASEGFASLRTALKEPAELALLGELEQGAGPRLSGRSADERFLDAMNELAPLHAPVDRFFVDVPAMT